MKNIDKLQELVQQTDKTIKEIERMLKEMGCISSSPSSAAVIAVAKMRIRDYEYLNEEITNARSS